MRILYIVGSMNKVDGWRTTSIQLGQVIAGELEKREYANVEQYYAHYRPGRLREVEKVISEVEGICSDGVPTVLIAHSLGGVVAHEVSQRLGTNIVGIICINSPLRISQFWNVDVTKTAVPVLAIGGHFDPVVFSGLASYEGLEAKLFSVDHVMAYIHVPAAREQLIKSIDDFLQEHSDPGD